MELSPNSRVPDGLLAAMTLLSEKPRLGVPSWESALHQGIDERNCTALLGLRFRSSEIVSGTVVAQSNPTPKSPARLQCEKQAEQTLQSTNSSLNSTFYSNAADAAEEGAAGGFGMGCVVVGGPFLILGPEAAAPMCVAGGVPAAISGAGMGATFSMLHSFVRLGAAYLQYEQAMAACATK